MRTEVRSQPSERRAGGEQGGSELAFRPIYFCESCDTATTVVDVLERKKKIGIYILPWELLSDKKKP